MKGCSCSVKEKEIVVYNFGTNEDQEFFVCKECRTSRYPWNRCIKQIKEVGDA